MYIHVLLQPYCTTNKLLGVYWYQLGPIGPTSLVGPTLCLQAQEVYVGLGPRA